MKPYYQDDQVTLYRPRDGESADERRRRLNREKARRHRARKRGEDVPWQPRPSGYSQSPEHVQKRADAIRGSKHPRWIGDAVSEKGGRSRALRMYTDIGPCEGCGASDAERHHVDGNTANNAPENIGILCRRCHMTADGRLDAVRSTPYRGCVK